MATAGAQLRLVKCPKCLKILPEPAALMYKCGGCGAILRAKNRGSSNQNVSSSTNVDGNGSLKLLHSSTEAQVARAGSRNSENCPREKGEEPSGIAETGEASSGAASDGKERVSGSTELLATTKSSEKGSSFSQKEAKSLQVGEQDSDNSRQLHDAKASPESVGQSDDSEEILGKLRSPTVSSSDDGTQSYLHDELKASPAASQSVASEEEMLDRPQGAMQINSLRSSTASSSDDGSRKHRQMSRRTFNQEEEEEKALNAKSSPESLSQSNGSEEGFDHLAHGHRRRSANLRSPTVSSSDDGTQNYLHDELKASPDLSQSAASEEEMLDRPHGAVRSSNLRSSTASSSEDGSHKFRQMSRRTIRDPRFSGSVSTGSGGGGDNLSRNSSVNANAAQRRGSLNSEAFFSVHSRVESEEEGPSRSLSRASAFSEQPPKLQNQSTKFKNLDLLTLVEELRDQLSGKKPRSRLGCSQDTYQWPQPCRSSQMPVSYSHCHLEPDLCCNNRLCSACSYDFCCHSSKPRRSVQHQKGRAARSYCRPVSGGAPFVVCGGCFEVLHMPADLLVSTGRLNKLKCGACSTVMALSFPARARRASQASDEAGRPSEGPVSFSGEYGISFADGSSVEAAEPELDVSRASPRSGASSGGAALHRLMGYSSARRLLF
ncbi:uncharacterized protein M6B38_305360 [Iris pallida]|uniref:Zinc-ribbon domain-containing protein n=1 Tax=Iris pallida TaxID=29817 RepID=A0AAX6HMJ7_IRIPA|nr:uncharacterized protein M6B38_305360 [Iris pallida]